MADSTIFVSILKRKTKLFYAGVVLFGLVNNLLFTGIIIFINQMITKNDSANITVVEGLVYFSLVIGALLSRRHFQRRMIILTNELLFDFEIIFTTMLRRANHESFERIGSERIYTVFGDIRFLSQLPQAFINFINSSFLLLCSIGYLFYNSTIGGAVVLTVMAMLLVFYLRRNRMMTAKINKVRDLQNDFYRYLRDLVFGFKELKISTKRSSTIADDYLLRNRLITKKLDVQASNFYLDNELISSLSWYLVIGLVLFGLPWLLNLSIAQIAVFIITILFMMNPVSSIVSVSPFLIGLKVALKRIKQIEDEVENVETDQVGKNSGVERMTSIRFERVVYNYGVDESGRKFTLGPVDFTLRKGETVFVTGGNGSGKSTFIKLLTGLYNPSAGVIYFNEQPVTDETRRYYSNHVSAVFTDHHLFTENYDGFDLDVDEYREYIKSMKLETVLKDNVFPSNQGFSKGQQKRFQMILALMEKKEIIILDEWAADQDPEFRSYFYQQFLKHLKVMNKTVILITHDDRYFSYADRIVKLSSGKLQEEQEYAVKITMND
ncbi:MAG: cyclic peptide transporter [Flavobacterium psychrophilum]|nr:MAG: cyclic peptide transporter [Flavobacterium psychrophilum]